MLISCGRVIKDHFDFTKSYYVFRETLDQGRTEVGVN